MSNDLVSKVQGEHDSLLHHSRDIFGKSSVCVISTILKTDNTSRKIFRSVVFVLFTFAFFYQCAAFLFYVLQYPTVVDHETLRPEMFVSPAYTFCNYNLMKRSKFCTEYPENCTKPQKQFCFENPRFCGTPDTMIVKGDILDLDDREQLFKLNHDAIDMVDFDEEDEDKPVGPFPRANKNEAGVGACFSYFERVNSPLEPVMKKRHPVALPNNERFIFDSQEYELIYPEAKSGIMFDVHSPFEPSNPFDSGIFMRPGYLYRITVKMTQEELLISKCLNYTEVWLKNNKNGYRSQEACRQKCVGDVVMNCHNCSEPLVLYPYPNTSFCKYDTDPSKLPAECKEPQPEVAVVKCMNLCKDDCLKLKFTYEVQENFLNSYAHLLTKNDSRKIRVVVEFSYADIEKIIHRPQYQVLEVFCLIGGLLAFWIGLSMFQIIEVFDCFIQIGQHIFTQRSTKSESSSA